jgi:hypothetical protein
MVQPTLAGLRSLSNRLAEMPGVVAVAEPTSMTWLALSVALRRASQIPDMGPNRFLFRNGGG